MTHHCPTCQKEFNSPEALVQHRKLAHAHTGAAPRPKSGLVIIGGIIGVIVIIVAFVSFSSSTNYDAFAQCISASGAKFYGAFWCSHCADQKALFGSSAHYLPYVECSAADKTELPACQQAGIQAYPTWIFSDGSRGSVLSLQELSQRTSCPLPA